MELYIAEKVAERRRELGLTQDELAFRIGVSSQAISNWERKVGYPDVTMLPSLANALGISTDELLGVGQLSDKEVFEQFRKEMRSISDAAELKRRLTGYCREYPNNFFVMEWIIWVVYRQFGNDGELTELAKRLGRRIINECTDTAIRLTARKVLAFISDDNEAQKYINTFDEHILLRPNIIGRREWDRGHLEEAHDYFDLEMVLIFRYVLERSSYCDDCPEKAVKWNMLLIDILKVMGDGNVPEGWLGSYGVTLMRLGAAQFAIGSREEGYRSVEKALEVYDMWYSSKIDRNLSVGRISLFDNVKIARTDHNAAVYIGDEEYPCYGIWETDVSEPLTSDSGWEWFDSVRGEARFEKLVSHAVALKEKYAVK